MHVARGIRDRVAVGVVARAAEAVIDALVAAHKAKLDELVTDGWITAEVAAERAAEAADRIADLVNGEIDFRPGFGPHPHFAEPDPTEGA